MNSEKNIARCPCGKIPEHLSIQCFGSYKYALVYGSCCGEWMIEFRVPAYDPDSPDAADAALEAWNKAPRADDLKEQEERL